MFNKKRCKNCENKVSSSYEFCPNCGNDLKNNSKKEDFGMLGKDDNINEFEQFSKSLFGGIGGSMINKMLGNAMKMLEKEMQKEIQRKPNVSNQPRTNFQLFVNGKKVNMNNAFQTNPQVQKEIQINEAQLNQFSEKNRKKFLGLPKKDPLTNVRRLADSVVYEISIPGTKSIEDTSIAKVGEGIEIKALAKNKAYFKSIPINFPIINYELSKGKLILELDAR